ncbi:CGP-CTERM sorting domain-containing protein [Thermococcus sp. 21S9]|nr:CGP-CTERM sorting domain-containing protein [Thermococcus sp. 21S9]
MLLFQNSWEKNGETVSIDNLDQFWDLYKLAYALHLYNSPRVYTVETWRFFLTNSRITVGMPDPISGVGSFVSARSVKPVSAEKTTTTGGQTTGSASSTEAPSTSSTSSGGGICGPAFIVGLAVLPLLLRRRK